MSLRGLGLVSAFFLFFPPESLGTPQESHGGYAVVCFNAPEAAEIVRTILTRNLFAAYPVDPLTEKILSKIKSVELLDLYLVKNRAFPRASELIVPQGASTFGEIIEERMAMLSQKGKIHGILTRLRTTALPDIGWAALATSVPEIHNSFSILVLPESCLLLQLAVQIQSGRASQVYYDLRLFERMSPLHQAALAFHEWFIYLAKERSQVDSRAVLAAVGAIFTEEFGSWSPNAVMEFFDRLKLLPTKDSSLLEEQ